MTGKGPEPVRGEVYLCEFDPARGSEQAGTRPAAIIERTAFASVRTKRHVLVAAFSTSPRCERLPFCVAVEPGGGTGLRVRSYLNASHLHAFSKDRLIKKLGKLSDDTLLSVDEALRLMLNL